MTRFLSLERDNPQLEHGYFFFRLQRGDVGGGDVGGCAFGVLMGGGDVGGWGLM